MVARRVTHCLGTLSIRSSSGPSRRSLIRQKIPKGRIRQCWDRRSLIPLIKSPSRTVRCSLPSPARDAPPEHEMDGESEMPKRLAPSPSQTGTDDPGSGTNQRRIHKQTTIDATTTNPPRCLQFKPLNPSGFTKSKTSQNISPRWARCPLPQSHLTLPSLTASRTHFCLTGTPSLAAGPHRPYLGGARQNS